MKGNMKHLSLCAKINSQYNIFKFLSSSESLVFCFVCFKIGSYYIAPWIHGDLLASASHLLGLKVSTVMPTFLQSSWFCFSLWLNEIQLCMLPFFHYPCIHLLTKVLMERRQVLLPCCCTGVLQRACLKQGSVPTFCLIHTQDSISHPLIWLNP